MQSIERYGVVALCFLIVTMVAVWAWDDQVTQAGEEVAHATEAGMQTPKDGSSSSSSKPRPHAREKARHGGSY